MCKYLFNMGISFYIKFFTFFLYLSIFMCKYLFSMGISFYIKFFTFFLYLLFLCVSIWSGCVIVCVIKLGKNSPQILLVSSTENAVYWKFLSILHFLLSFYIYHFYV